jgi:hypothetical protein
MAGCGDEVRVALSAPNQRNAATQQKPRSCGRSNGFADADVTQSEPPRLGRNLALPMWLKFNRLHLNGSDGVEICHLGASPVRRVFLFFILPGRL